MSSPGWYPDPGGKPNTQRYWDGQQWGKNTLPIRGQSRPSSVQSQQHQPLRAPGGPLQVKGWTGQVAFDGDFVTIDRKGFLARTSIGKGQKRIPLGSISAVQWKPAGPVVNGFIEFTVPGGNEGRSRFGAQTTDAAHNENSVVFTRGQMPAFEHLRAVIEQAIVARSRPVHVPQHQPLPPRQATAGDQIAQLAALHQAGSLTDAEFSAAKARLLGL